MFNILIFILFVVIFFFVEIVDCLLKNKIWMVDGLEIKNVCVFLFGKKIKDIKFDVYRKGWNMIYLVKVE